MLSPPISSVLDRHAAERGSATLVVTDAGCCSYAEGAAAAAALRAVLAERGVRAGDRALVLAPNGIEYLIAWFALSGLDATMVPIHAGLPDLGVHGVVRDCGATWAIGTGAFLEARVGGLAAIDRDHRIAVDDVDLAGPGLAGVGVAEHPCGILYTSGTTGPPKGAVLSHHAYLASGAAMAAGIGVESADRIVTALPLFHANPQFYAVATALSAGASIALLERFSPRTFVEDAARLGATGFTYVGTILTLLAGAGPPAHEHRLRFCVGGGAPPSVWREIESWGVRVHELYGSTETAGFVTLTTPASSRIGTCGRARDDFDVAIVDPDDHLLPSGEQGEIVVRPRAPSVMFDGYHGKPQLSISRTRNLWFHTGDLGRIDDDGFLEFGGRLDDRIRRGGENIDPPAVESVLNDHPEVRESVVVGVDDETMGQEVKAVLVASAGFDPWSLPTYLEGRLPRLAWPRYVELRDALPKTSTQKVVVKDLRSAEGDLVDLRRPAPNGTDTSR